MQSSMKYGKSNRKTQVDLIDKESSTIPLPNHVSVSSQTDKLSYIFVASSLHQGLYYRLDYEEHNPTGDEKSESLLLDEKFPSNIRNLVLQTPCRTQLPSRSPLIPATAAVAEDASLFVMDGLQAKEKSVLHSLNDSLHSDADIIRAVDTDDDRHTEDSSKSSMVTNVSSVN